jgi:Family of unknown function (DUF6790)
MIFLYLFFILPVLTALVHTAVAPRPLERGQVLEIWIGHVIFWGVGIGGLAAFVVLSFTTAADWVAEDVLRWSKGNPFQFTLAWSYLAIGISGLMCLWVKGGFRVATALISIIFGVGEFLSLIWGGAPWKMLAYSITYDLVGSSVLAALLIWYYLRCGPSCFWDCHGCRMAKTTRARDSSP